MRFIIAFSCIISTILLVSGCSDRKEDDISTISGASDTNVALVQDRFIIRESALDHSGTVSALLTALDRRDLTVFAVIDHAAGAQSVGLDLPLSTLVIFGNPRGGTPLMQSEPLMGAELPLRALIYQRDDKIYLAVSGMDFLERNYQLDARTKVIDNIKETLAAISVEATQI